MNDLGGYTIDDLEVGMKASFSKTITDADIVLFAGVSGDHNAVHTNEAFAARTPFKGRIAHGMLSASIISAAIANRLPGPGSIYLGQNLRFVAPVRPGDTVSATVSVTRVQKDKGIAHLETVCTVHDSLVVITGDAVVKVPRSAGAS